MPARKKPAQPVAPTPTVVPEPKSTTPLAAAPTSMRPDLPIIYPDIEIHLRCVGSEFGPLGPDYAAASLGWETEKEFQARKCKESPNTKPEQWLFGDVYHCRNVAGEKVRCNNNAYNRPFDESWCEDLVHTILFGQWAGPHTIPNEGTVNGETIRISRYGRTISGQHSLSACKLANEFLHKARFGVPRRRLRRV